MEIFLQTFLYFFLIHAHWLWVLQFNIIMQSHIFFRYKTFLLFETYPHNCTGRISSEFWLQSRTTQVLKAIKMPFYTQNTRFLLFLPPYIGRYLLQNNYTTIWSQQLQVFMNKKITRILLESFKGNTYNKLPDRLVIFTGKIIFILKYLPGQILAILQAFFSLSTF